MPKIRHSKPRGTTTNSKEIDSFRAKLDGLITVAELREMLNETVDRIEALGATHLRWCSLYVTPSDVRGQKVSLVQNGRVVKQVKIEPPYRSAADDYGV